MVGKTATLGRSPYWLSLSNLIAYFICGHAHPPLLPSPPLAITLLAIPAIVLYGTNTAALFVTHNTLVYCLVQKSAGSFWVNWQSPAETKPGLFAHAKMPHSSDKEAQSDSQLNKNSRFCTPCMTIAARITF